MTKVQQLITSLNEWLDEFVVNRIRETLLRWKYRKGIRGWLGSQYVLTRTSEVHRDLWGYILIPGAFFMGVALLTYPIWR